MKCPGQDMKYWKAGAIFDAPCPKCNNTVEFYKDDTSRKCSNCGHRFVNPKMDFGCASYCPYAEQCLGNLPDEFVGAKDNLLKDKVAVEMKRYFQTDFKSIRQATATARFVEEIGKEEGGELAILLCAAFLHDIETTEAQAILKKVGASEPLTNEICEILQRTTPVEESKSLQVKILQDALGLRHLQEELKDGLTSNAMREQLNEMRFFTNTAKSLAASLGK